jgi:hypothetical protein
MAVAMILERMADFLRSRRGVSCVVTIVIYDCSQFRHWNQDAFEAIGVWRRQEKATLAVIHLVTDGKNVDQENHPV